jgi:uncharacterized protein YecE (DUF72 family)
VAPHRGEVRIGISGWRYPPWRGTFYPRGLAQRRELAFASRAVRTIELNGSFYSLQTPASYRAWREDTPNDFVFAVKGGRFITHNKKLRDVRGPLANFLASGVLALREKLGPFLWQLPPQLRFDERRLADFFALLPRTTSEAARLARRHDQRLKTRAWTRVDEDRPLRHALEVRHASFVTGRFIELLREHQVALVVADTAGKWPWLEDVTADFVYVRLHGDKQLYASGYGPRALAEWTRKIRAWREGRRPVRARAIAPHRPPPRGGCDVFVYFDNDVKVRAPFDAMALAHRLGLGPKPGRPPAARSIAEVPRTSWPALGSRRGRAAAR